MTAYTLKTTNTYRSWLANLKDRQARAGIELRMRRAKEGNLGDHKSVGHGTSEMRVHIGAGYRLYYSNPPKASYGVALPRRTNAYCLRQHALSETFGVSLYTVRDRQIIFLLLGGDKSSQKADIAAAQKIKKELFP